MRNNNGFSLVELQVSIIVAGILVLAIGAISGLSTRSFNNITTEAQVYNDISYGFKLAQNRIRRCDNALIETPGAPWVGEKLVVDDSAFGLYRPDDGNTIDFVYIINKDDETDRETLFSVANSEVINLDFTTDTDSVTIQLDGEVSMSGQTRKIPFNIETTVVRRVS